MVSPFYNSSRPKGPLSIASAPMIIIAHGSCVSKGCGLLHLLSLGTIGEVRSDNGKDTKVYVSNDGGYTWKVGIDSSSLHSASLALWHCRILVFQLALMYMELLIMAMS